MTANRVIDKHSELTELDFASAGHTGFASTDDLTTTSGTLQTDIDTKLENIVEDITPELGGDLGCGGYNLDNVGKFCSLSLATRVYNNTGTTLTKGTAVTICGLGGEVCTVCVTDNREVTKMPCCGIIYADITNGSEGCGIRLGRINMNTSGMAGSEGDRLYVQNDGSLDTTIPTSGMVQRIGFLVVKAAGSAGRICVCIRGPRSMYSAKDQHPIIRMGDDVGHKKAVFKDYNDNEVGAIDSDGNITLSGTIDGYYTESEVDTISGTLQTDIDANTALSHTQGTDDKIIEGNTSAEVVDTGSDGHFKVITEGTERLRVDDNEIDFVGGNAASDTIGIRLSNTTTNATAKHARIKCRHYTNSEEPVTMLYGISTATDNWVDIGGGTTNRENAATIIRFLTGASTTTLGGTERMRISSDGEVTIPYQPAFCVHPTSDQENLIINNWVQILFGTERFDQGNNFASNIFTAPVTGKYQLNLSLRLLNVDTGATEYWIKIDTSNKTYYYVFAAKFTEDLTSYTIAFSLLPDMDINDTANVSYYQTAGVAQVDIDTDSYFSGHLVC